MYLSRGWSLTECGESGLAVLVRERINHRHAFFVLFFGHSEFFHEKKNQFELPKMVALTILSVHNLDVTYLYIL